MENLPIEMMNNAFFIALCGFICIFILDVFFLCIEELFDTDIFHHIKDFIFTLFYALLFILLIYYFSNGVFRLIYFLSIVSGTLLYIITVRKIVKIIVRILIKPLKYLLLSIRKNLRKLYIFLLHTIEKLELRLYNKSVNWIFSTTMKGKEVENFKKCVKKGDKKVAVCIDWRFGCNHYCDFFNYFCQ